MAKRGNIPAGKELMGFYIDRAVAKRVRVAAAERGERNSAFAERALMRELEMAEERPQNMYEDWAGAEVRKDKGVAVVETYRAAIYRHPEGEEQVMTAPEHADLADEELIDLAMKEANSAGLIGDAWPQVPDAEFRRRLYVGEWAER